MDKCIFDKVIERKGTHSLKFDFPERHGQRSDAMPLWVADMDFSAPECVVNALKKDVERGIFGYGEPLDSYYEAVQNWFKTYYGWETKREWIVKTPGIVYALAMAVQAFTKEGEGVLIQPPVYYPFTNVIKNNNRKIYENPLVYKDGKYTIDFDDFEKKASDENVKLFMLCSPHNPVGRVWTKEELSKMGKICEKHGVRIVADEIHCDFAFEGHEHTNFCVAVPSMAENVCICTAPSKTFNLAGFQTSNIFIPGEKMREEFMTAIAASGYTQPALLGITACEAAYRDGRAWFEELKKYLAENLAFVRDYIKENTPALKLVEPDGMYFAWVDCSGLGLSSDELENLISQKAGLWLDSGSIFGKSGEQFQRIVLACPRKVLEEAMDKLKNAINDI